MPPEVTGAKAVAAAALALRGFSFVFTSTEFCLPEPPQAASNYATRPRTGKPTILTFIFSSTIWAAASIAGTRSRAGNIGRIE